MADAPVHARDAYPAETIAAHKAGGSWADLTLADLLSRHVAARPGGLAVVGTGARLTWAELDAQVGAAAGVLRELGVGPGSRVALQLPNWAEFVTLYLAAQRRGAVLVPTAYSYASGDVIHMLRVSGADTWILPVRVGGRDYRHEVAQVREEVPHVRTVLRVAGPHVGPGDDVAADAPVLERVRGVGSVDAPAAAGLRPDPDALSRLTFTSGTTALPKAVVHTHNTDLVAPAWLRDALTLDESTPLWIPSPVTHTAGLVLGLFVSLLAGSPLVLQERWDVEEALRIVARERAHYTVGATPFLTGLLDQGRRAVEPLRSLTYFVCGGTPIPPDVVRRARAEIGVSVLRGFGQSEAPLHTLNRPEDADRFREGYDGRPFPGAELAIGGRPWRPGRSATGAYATRGPHVFLGYFNDPDATSRDLAPDGWYRSGDICEVGPEGFVRYVDRVKDVINRGGLKISAMEVEQLVLTHEGVAAAAVVPVPDDVLGQRIGIYLVAAPGSAPLSKEQVTGHLAELGVSKTKWPERVGHLDRLPMTASGKVQKSELPPFPPLR
ncbi:AMP-binding protein [Nocardioides humi]|uniref:Cyclohexanecarboxylate-CoA ligase n=1 Tax=Nocardioides humi TaxID=449461 RepID=A0ABN2BSQ2_9ACTN|nr:AMP-binding protein [Nocardioides humi]